ncbi:MAG: hypothetical protein ABFD90_05620 [Phycisphaerales bacterium]
MSESKKLTKRQSAVIEDLFAGELEEQAILEKHHVRQYEYERWLADERFTGRLDLRIAHAHRQSRMVLARHAIAAAAKLVELTRCDKEETARKACLDIIAPPTTTGQNPPADAGSDENSAVATTGGLTPELAGRLLAALARERQDRETNRSS